MPTPKLQLPYIAASQYQKEVSWNESQNRLDAMVQLAALDYANDPPGSPSNGQVYLVGASPTGAWSGQAQAVAAYLDGTWIFFPPNEGWLAFDAAAGGFRHFDGSTWVLGFGAGSGENNTASNVGTGEGQVFKDKSGVDLRFRTLKQGANIALTPSADEIEIAAAGSTGEANTASNVNAGGVGVFRQKSGVDLQFRGVNAGSPRLSVSLDAANHEIDVDVVEAQLSLANLGTRSLANLSDGFSLAGQAGKDVRVNAGATALEAYAPPYDVGVSLAGTPTADAVLVRYPFPRAVSFPAGMTGSRGVCGTAPSADTVFSLRKGGVEFGTMTLANGATTATFAAASATSFAAGEVLTIVAPANLNGLADLGLALAGTR